MITQNKAILKWREILLNENLLTDAYKFRDWDQVNLEIPEKETLIKDLTRTRNDDPYFKKESTQRNLMLLATFYCQQNSVNYQQGMLEIVAPFLVMKNKDFPIYKCYAYFNSFMNTYFPKVLEWNILQGEKQLAHVLCAIQFCEILLKYHCSDFYNRILKLEDFNLSMVVTPLIMTLFAKGTSLQLVFLIFDEYMKRKNPNYIFFMVTALFMIQRQEILSFEDSEELFMYLNKKLKCINYESDIQQLFERADELRDQTPQSYEQLIASTSFNDKSVLSVEDITELTQINKSYYFKCLFIEVSEMKSLLGKSKKQSTKKIQLRLLDIRKDKKPKLKEFVPKEFIVKKADGNLHTCLIMESNKTIEYAVKVAQDLILEGVRHVSILKGGFQQLSASIKQQKDCSIM
ncbi:unnamed protein product [Paramecium sonneborni]|uniref:Rab-GAP TBC domain-containing protein n=1 Tax=Paramecium sonneborni TaxID=65129 RepID=A0A8S1QQZ9_9CILI|nr:unnamed protein product [Paramecium sonneborni]